MKINDDETINKRISKKAAAEIAKRFNVKVIPYSDITIVEGDDENVKEAVKAIVEDVNTYQIMPETSNLEKDQVLTDYDERNKYYHTYHLIDFDENKNKWKCKVSTFTRRYIPLSGMSKVGHFIRAQIEYVESERLKKFKTLSNNA